MPISIHFGRRCPSPDVDPTVKLFRMPGGEWHVQSSMFVTENTSWAYVQGASADDLVALSVWADAMHRDGGHPRALIPYLPGARQDRRRTGEALSCKVYADLINRCRLEVVICLDPHSDVMPALIENCIVVPAVEAVNMAPPLRISGVIAPDAGARKRAEAVAAYLHVPVYQAFKHRDMATGKLSGFSCEALPVMETLLPAPGRFLVVDDICDGGGTFIGLAKALGLPRERLALWVTHGVFSGKANALEEHYGEILTTDSHPGAEAFSEKVSSAEFHVNVIPVMDHLACFANLRT